MKISALNHSNFGNINKLQNFQGLWGKTSRNSDFDQALGIPKVEEVCYYYPFQDETREEIQSVVEKNTEAYIDESEDTPKYKIRDCRVCTTLPFQKDYYLNYVALSSKSKLQDKMKVVHTYVKDKYTTSEYGPKQSSAVNENLVQKLNINC